MYRLFLSATLRIAVITVIMLALALGSAAVYSIYQIYQEQAVTLADRAVVAVAFREASDLPITPEYLESIAGSDSVKVNFSDGRTVLVESPMAGSEFIATEVDPLGQFSVTAGINQRAFFVSLGIVTAIVLVISAVSLYLAYRIAIVESRRVNKPLGQLASHAETIGTGRPVRKAQPTGIDEIDRIARVLDDRGARVREVLEAERRTSREMSHQVRTPLTALSLRLQEIILTDDLGEAKEEAAVGIVQIDRLTDVIEQLVRGRREGIQSEQEAINLGEMVKDQIVEWYPAFAIRKRRIVHQQNAHVVAWANKTGQSQVLSTLIENCLVHGRGDVLIRVRISGKSAVLEVVDTRGVMRLKEHLDPFERGVSANGTGLGLALARTLVSADDGDIALTSRRPVTFTVYLPLYAEQDVQRASAEPDAREFGPA